VPRTAKTGHPDDRQADNEGTITVISIESARARAIDKAASGMSAEDRIRDLDRRLLVLRADRMACRAMLDASRDAIERLESYASLTAGRTRVPPLALARLRSLHREWESVLEDITRRMDAETGVLAKGVAS
jgi:hypothetical protein